MIVPTYRETIRPQIQEAAKRYRHLSEIMLLRKLIKLGENIHEEEIKANDFVKFNHWKKEVQSELKRIGLLKKSKK